MKDDVNKIRANCLIVAMALTLIISIGVTAVIEQGPTTQIDIAVNQVAQLFQNVDQSLIGDESRARRYIFVLSIFYALISFATFSITQTGRANLEAGVREKGGLISIIAVGLVLFVAAYWYTRPVREISACVICEKTNLVHFAIVHWAMNWGLGAMAIAAIWMCVETFSSKKFKRDNL